ncbi:MAG: peptidylprolyl isomerase [Acidobacteria bacterium]|nr:peptidylprolyl isomerase [Acidobacteriota bacterium]
MKMVMGVVAILLFQLPLERALLEEEDARVENPAVLFEALKNPDTRIQRMAVRALGRFERLQYADAVRLLAGSPDAKVRAEAVNALGQMKASLDYFLPLIGMEKDANARAVIYETAGRLGAAQEVLVEGLKDSDPVARTGAAKGLEALFRLHAKAIKPSPAAISALRDGIRDNSVAAFRELALLALNAAGDADPATLAVALNDPEPQVRRLAVIGSKQWEDDPSPMVRYEALKAAGNCDRATAALRDSSDNVVLLAIDQLGNKCSGKTLERIVDADKDWRRQSRALVSLAKADPGSARKRLPKFVEHEKWQVRVYAATAAKILKDAPVLSRLSRDKHPNVIAAAISTPRDALRVIDSPDYGLVYEAARALKGWQDGRLAVTTLLAVLDRISREKKATSRDPRMEILQRLDEFGDIRVAGEMRSLLSDFDPAVAKLAAEIISEKTGNPETPRTRRYVTSPLPPDVYIRGLTGAAARIKLREAGAFTLQLFSETPATVAVFAQLAENGYYNGLTMHRIAPNFVAQGGSPGGNEYAGADYMRDELGLASNVRGTVGLSTRGRDTGDAQFYINLVDNFRLDHNYTVFAQITDGIENIDRIQEGDVIESIEIRRQVQPQ